MLAEPLASSVQPRTVSVPVSRNLTEPVGVGVIPPVGVTVTVKVTSCPTTPAMGYPTNVVVVVRLPSISVPANKLVPLFMVKPTALSPFTQTVPQSTVQSDGATLASTTTVAPLTVRPET